MTAAPVVILGVSRSGTTLLREMLNRSSGLEIPTESYFIPQLWDRHGERPDLEAIVADLARHPRVREWGVRAGDIRRGLGPGPRFADVVAAVYGSYAAARGKPRYGDKTPLYMQHLDVLEHAFPGARYVHIVRDGRDAALSFMAMRRRPRLNLARPRALDTFACAWRQEVRDARRLGRTAAAGRYVEVRFEDLVADPEASLRRICSAVGLPFEAAMLDYHRHAGAAAGADHALLSAPPASRERWPDEMGRDDLRRFEAIAGDALAAFGYRRACDAPPPALAAYAAAARAAYAARLAAWQGAVRAYRRTPAWRVRQRWLRAEPG